MISFADAPGTLFNRLGKLGKVLKYLHDYQNNQYYNLGDLTYGAVAQYNAEPDIQAIIGANYLNAMTPPESIANLVQQVAVQTINRVVYRDNPQISQTLSQLNTL